MLLRKGIAVCLMLVPAVTFAASGEAFYQRLYDRGMADFASANYESAYLELRNAAFGFVDDIELFETAQTYVALAASRLKHDADAHDALDRIVAAEMIEPHFRTIKLTDELRKEIDTAAASLLTPKDALLLGVSQKTIEEVAAAKPRVIVPQPKKQPNVSTTAPHDPGSVDTAPPPAQPPPQPPTVKPKPD
jgi:hypothetical protein